MRDRIVRRPAQLERLEDERLAPYAIRSAEATFRRGDDRQPSDDIRLAFQRDRDRILHSRAFRRLKHKTQVFVPHLADHRRTRLTHTLEVSQIGRTIARALGLNEDLVEAIGLGHDLGHTAFGHTGETILDEILRGACPEAPLPPDVAARAGAFKHSYQSLRVVDLLEEHSGHPGLDLSDQVREGILKHTRWRIRFPFPLPSTEGLSLDRPCHLEGQVVAMADEIAQQTHDLEDGVRVGSVQLERVEQLRIAQVIRSQLGTAYDPSAPARTRQSLLIRGMIRLFVTDVIEASELMLVRLAERFRFTTRAEYLPHARAISQTTIRFSRPTAELFSELKRFIYRFIINHPQVNRQDWRARKVITGLFRAFWLSPLNLPSDVLHRATSELGFVYLRDLPQRSVAAEVASRYHSSPGFARLVADHIAGMSDRFALEEYGSLEQPSPDQRFVGDLR